MDGNTMTTSVAPPGRGDAGSGSPADGALAPGELSLQLLERAGLTKDPTERSALLEEVFLLNTPLAERIARRYRGRGLDGDDLLQVGYVGLVKAVQGFQPADGASFVAYAIPTISGEIKKYFRDQGWAVKPPRRIQELQGALNRLEPELVQSLGRPATPADLAQHLDVDVADVVEALSVDGCFAPLSLDAPVGGSTTFGELVPDEDDPFERVDQWQTLAPVMAGLDERERQILVLRFVFRYTQDRIGAEIGVSQMQVSRLLRGVLQKLRQQLEPRHEPGPGRS